MGLGDAQLPRQTCVLDGGAGCSTGAAVIAGHQNDLCAALGNTGGNSANTGLADQLDIDVSIAVGVFQIVDQLCQILDGVDIVVGRGRDQAHAGGAVAGLGDPRMIYSALTRYLLVTPKRAEATCLILELLSLW